MPGLGISLALTGGGGAGAPAPSTLLDGLISYYSLADTSDAHGSNTLTNSLCTFIAGKVGNCANHATSSVLSSSAAGLVPGSSDWTIAGWFYWSGSNDAHSIFDAGSNYLLLTQQVGRVRGKINVGASFAQTSLGSTLTANTWTHLVLTIDRTANIMAVYANTTASGTVDIAAVGSLTGTTFKIHSGVPGNKADEVGVWNRVLTAAEISEHYNSGSGLAYPFT